MFAAQGQRKVTRHSKDEGDEDKTVDDDCYDKPFQAYQLHLSNVMTLGMLLLGFIITGTLLSCSFSGTETFSSEDSTKFIAFATVTALLAMALVILAFLVSTRGVYWYASASAKRGVLALYNSILLVALAEVLMYLSLEAFMWSLAYYIDMVFRGPDICVGMSGENGLSLGSRPQHVRPLAFCGQLGDDLFVAANGTCLGHRPLVGPTTLEQIENSVLTDDAHWSSRSRNADHYVLCSVFDWYVAKSEAKFGGEALSYYFAYETLLLPLGARRDDGKGMNGWEHSGKFKSEFFWQNLDEVTTAYCDRDAALELRNNLCGSMDIRSATLVEKQACATARQSFVIADKCVADVQDDAIKCHKVCKHNMEHVDVIYACTQIPCWIASVFLLALVFFRCLKNYWHFHDVRQVLCAMGQDKPRKGCEETMLELAGIEDVYDEESSSEASSSRPLKNSRTCFDDDM